MRRKRGFFAAVCAAGMGIVGSADATPAEMRTVTIALSPENAAVAVNGHPRQHPNGSLELRGPLGAVFTIEAVANGGTIVEKVAITDIGALPAKLLVPPPQAATAGRGPNLTLPDALAADECAQRTWWDTDGVKHYKPQCLGLDDPWTVSAAAQPAPPAGTPGSLTIVCSPKCDHIFDNGTDLGPGHIFNRSVPPGPHALSLTAPNGAKKSLLVNVVPDQTRELRVTMDVDQQHFAADLLSSALESPFEERRIATNATDADEGYLTLASYPWTRVSENGRSLCLTPCVNVPLAPGVHVLVLENDAIAKQSTTVTIHSGEITVKRLALK